ncbi:MAG: hypothetical protein J6I45_09700 [Clostridia bacterium]|nr:hypothetical protein [Clostridia bacterium]
MSSSLTATERLDRAEATLQTYFAECVSKARTTFPPAYKGGKSIASINPNGSVGYRGIWPDDFYIPVHAGHLFTNAELTDILEFLTDSVVDLPFLPDCVQEDGMPHFAFGGKYSMTGVRMSMSLLHGWTQLLRLFEHRGIQIPEKKRWLGVFRRSYADLTFSCGLLYSNPNIPHITYAYHDIVAITGFELMASTYTSRSLEHMCELFADVANEEELAEWQRRADDIKKNIKRLYDDERGIYYAGSFTCRQPDIWGSGLAAGISDRETRAAIAKFLVDHAVVIFSEGMTRQTDTPDGWERLIIPFEKGEYMNGGFWARGTAYVLPVLYEFYPDFALDLLEALVESLPKYQFAECVSANTGLPKCTYFLMSVAPNIVAVRAMRRGLQLYDLIGQD